VGTAVGTAAGTAGRLGLEFIIGRPMLLIYFLLLGVSPAALVLLVFQFLRMMWTRP